MAAVNTTDTNSRGKFVTSGGAASTAVNPFAEVIDETPVPRLDSFVDVQVRANTLVETAEGELKQVNTVVDTLTITPKKGTTVRHFTDEVLVTLRREGEEDTVATLYRLIEENAAKESADFAVRQIIAALESKVNVGSTVTITDAANSFGAINEAVAASGGDDDVVLAISKKLKTRLLSALATDGRPVLRSIEELPGVSDIIEFKGGALGEIGYVFDASRLKAARYYDLSGIKISDSVIEVDGEQRVLWQNNELGGLLEYTYGAGISGAAGSVAKLVYEPTAE